MTAKPSPAASQPMPRYLGWFIIAIVAMAPLPLGAARPWSAALLATLLAIALLLWSLAQFRSSAPPRIGLRALLLPGCLFGIAVLWGMWQTLPWVPQSWVHPLWNEAAEVLGPLPGTVSLTPLAGRDAVMQLLCYATTFFLVLQYGRDPIFAWRLIGTIALTTALNAAYGTLNVVTGAEKIGWLDKWAYLGMATGTLVNANHFATMVGFGLLGCLAMLLRRSEDPGSLRHSPRLVWAIAAVILMVTLPLTHSRAGMLTTACGVLLLLSIVAWRRQDRRLAFGIVSALAVIAIGLLAISGDATVSWELSAAHRFQVYELTMVLIGERPLLGTGLGSFMDIFATVRSVGIVPNWNAVHDTYLELALELGVPAAMAMLAAQGWLVWRCFHGAARRGRHWLICALAAAASLQLALHSIIDFSAQIPAVAVCWSALLGLGVAQSWSSRRAAG